MFRRKNERVNEYMEPEKEHLLSEEAAERFSTVSFREYKKTYGDYTFGRELRSDLFFLLVFETLMVILLKGCGPILSSILYCVFTGL